METLREGILRQELQRKIEQARSLEKDGKQEEASRKYLEASSLYRRIAVISPRERAGEMFSAAEQYETFGKTISHAGQLKQMSRTDPELFEEAISNLIISEKPDTKWDDIGGLSDAKSVIKEAIILPFIRDKPPFVRSQRTILLYGPPGTGKSMLAKAASNTLNATFFEARLSTLLSKYFGESTKLVSALFGKARKMQPAVIFMDELDSIAMRRSGDTSEASRRVLGELLTQIEGFGNKSEDRILVMGATNKPWDLDEAAISRFQCKIYVPLPDERSRRSIFQIHLEGAGVEGSAVLGELARRTEGFSGRDIRAVCQEATSGMIRQMNPELEDLSSRQVESYRLKTRTLSMSDFDRALLKVKPATSKADAKRYEDWKKEFGG